MNSSKRNFSYLFLMFYSLGLILLSNSQDSIPSTSSNNETNGFNITKINCLLIKQNEKPLEYLLRFNHCEILKPKRPNNTCFDPDEATLNKRLFEFHESMDGASSLLNFDFVNENFKLHDSARDHFHPHESSYYGNRKCIKNRLIKDETQGGLCPWHYNITYRYNVYPHISANVRCNCVNCKMVTSSNDDFKLGCQQVKVWKPALLRAKCRLDGIYEWTPILEQVAVACECMRYESDFRIERQSDSTIVYERRMKL